jgi:energy-coupling factor transporter ATP-binding protein EcfA2
MELRQFRIQNFRSVEDGGKVGIDKIAALVGRNESGKSNLLLALATLNPATGRTVLSKIKDFPRGRRLDECTDDTRVVTTHWKLNDTETAKLKETFGFGDPITEVEIGRPYGTQCSVELKGLQEPTLDLAAVHSAIRSLGPVLMPRMDEVEDSHKTNLQAAWGRVEATFGMTGEPKAWAAEVTPAATQLRARLGEAAIMLDTDQDALLAKLEEMATLIGGFDQARINARNLVLSWLPIFIYVSDFPELSGHQNIDQFLKQRGNDLTKKEAEDNFEKMAKVAGFSPQQLSDMRDDHETRNQLLNRAGALVTQVIRRLWKDRALKIRFNIDGPHLDTFVSDPNAVYDVEVNLDERSRGFKWFFSFYITFAADTQGGNADGAILLLDEPGLHLHATSQADLLKHLREDFKNQIIYTTHSPFMVPPDAINIVRTVNIDQERGTTVTNNPTGDARTLFPLRAALGYYISQTLFVGHSNLIVEGVTDFWIISSVNAHFHEIGTPAVPNEVAITPAGGAGKVSYMAALLASWELNVLVLLDDEKAGRQTYNELVKSKLVRDRSIIFVTEGFSDPKPAEADIEDLIDPAIYATLVNDTYRAELAGKTLTLNAKIQRIAKRYEQAFEQVGLQFNKSRPAREFMARMGSAPASVLSAESAARFKAVFKAVRERYARLQEAGRGPFGIHRRERDEASADMESTQEPAASAPVIRQEASLEEISASMRRIEEGEKGGS